MNIIYEILASCILVLRNFVRLMTSPYAAMRQISSKPDWYQAGIILGAVYAYFIYASAVRTRLVDPLILSASASRAFVFFLMTVLLASAFFFLIGQVLERYNKAKPMRYDTFIYTLIYSLPPTLIWFFTTSTLFYFLPPPRYETFLGSAFSIFFVIFSLSMLVWRLILWYIALRFTLRARFFSIVAVMMLFAMWFIPYSVVMYRMKIFRIPFL